MLIKAKKLNHKKEFDEVLCLISAYGFKEGHIYPAVGWNNGTQVVRCGLCGDTEVLLCYNTSNAEESEFYLTTREENSDEDITIFKYLTMNGRRLVNRKEANA
jgi:hypothetical protein